jgi:hypothetical protein
MAEQRRLLDDQLADDSLPAEEAGSQFPFSDLTKEATSLPLFGAAIGTAGAVNSLEDSLGLSAPSRTDTLPPISVPDIDVTASMALNKARARMAASRLMQDDEVIGRAAEEDPEAVMSAIEELSDTIPGIINRPLALQAAMRRKLELNVVEPHELAQLAKVVRPDRSERADG